MAHKGHHAKVKHHMEKHEHHAKKAMEHAHMAKKMMSKPMAGLSKDNEKMMAKKGDKKGSKYP